MNCHICHKPTTKPYPGSSYLPHTFCQCREQARQPANPKLTLIIVRIPNGDPRLADAQVEQGDLTHQQALSLLLDSAIRICHSGSITGAVQNHHNPPLRNTPRNPLK